MLKTEQIIYMYSCSFERASIFVDPLNSAMSLFDIDNLYRQAAFLAQVGHESGKLLYVRELYSGERYDVGLLAKRLGNTPEDDGDGEKYRGRGLIQITGRYNYNLCGNALKLPLLDQPELLERPLYASLSAGWFWKDHGLNELADEKKFEKITKVINGGLNGQKERLEMYNRFLELFK
jgi:putative chitinase